MLQALTTTLFRQLGQIMLHFKGPTTEHSYKNGRSEPRYVKEMVYPPLSFEPDLPRTWSAEDEEIEASFLRSAEHARQFSWFPQMEDEHVFVTVVDADGLRLTIDIDGGRATVRRGWDTSRPPTMVLPINRQNVTNLEALLQPGVIAYEGLYRIIYVLALPATRAVYSIPFLREPGDKGWIGMDDFVHIDIPPVEPVTYQGRPIHIQMTVVNVDGQWLVMEGLHGDPDVRFQLTIDDAARWYRFAVYELRKVKNSGELIDLARRVADVTQKSIVYLRSDHR
jgi:hypothetical protein